VSATLQVLDPEGKIVGNAPALPVEDRL